MTPAEAATRIRSCIASLNNTDPNLSLSVVDRILSDLDPLDQIKDVCESLEVIAEGLEDTRPATPTKESV